MKVAESNLSAELFYHLKYMICTNRKKIFVDLPPTSAVTKDIYYKHITSQTFP